VLAKPKPWRRLAACEINVAAGVSPAKSNRRVACEMLAADTAASTVKGMIKDRPRRLDLIYINPPLYFVTFATRDRKSIPSLDRAQVVLEQYAHCGIAKFHVALGRYVLMPDHVHLFVRGDRNFRLSSWIGGLKRAISVALRSQQLWQAGFFDHILRSEESYAEKWNYVRDNPVRAGLVEAADDWPYQGEIVLIDRV
jgi:REP-associated tyrosine transposase